MHRQVTRIILLSLAPLVPAVSSAQDAARADSAPLTFERDIRPIFRAYCFDCHGATEKKKGRLDLRLARFARRGGRSGPAIIPGKPAESLLLERVREGEMPPGAAHLSAGHLRTLERWIAAGAPTARAEPESIGAGIGITAEERAFWSLQAIERPDVPKVEDPRARNEIDAFLVAAMPSGLSLSKDAAPGTLLRRVSLDLTGLPPSRDEADTFLGETLRDPSGSAYERLVDRLLASPRFGERWARHWLDVAGYADSEGGSNSDTVREWAYKYRDWVIRAFNRDVPLDRFLTEQLAGDELAGPKEGDWSPEQVELLTATGFLRMAADGTASRNDAETRNQVVADTLKILGSSLLGLSLGCAQCHDHRYDPILHTDYYALRAIFEPSLDWKAWRTPPQRRVSLSTRAERDLSAKIEEEAQRIAAGRSEKQSRYLEEALEKELLKYEEPRRSALRRAYRTPAGKRSDEDKQLLAKHPSVNIHPGVLYQYNQKAADDLKTYDKRIADVRKKKPKEEFLRALVEPPGHAPPTHRFHRGDYRQPQEVVAPGIPVALAPPGGGTTLPPPPVLPNAKRPIRTTGRRLEFARWLTSDRNPLTARVLVNRVWLHLFGRGLVTTPSDFGKLGTPPSHPELLDWLADSFRRDGWSLKKLVRRIVLSSAYRQSSRRDPARDAIDRENRFYWRQSIRRLDAEVLRDCILAATGQLGLELFGPPVPIVEDETGQVIVQKGANRRSVYVQARRSQPVALLEAFDAPVMVTNCEKRPSSTVATQALMLLNGSFLLDQAHALAERCRREAEHLVDPNEVEGISTADTEVESGRSDRGSERRPDLVSLARRIAAAWKLAYGRPATREEIELGVEFICRQQDTLTGAPKSLPGKRTPAAQAMTDLCQMLLVSNEFLYVQ